eukprot:GHVP01040386.1.p1 GENE.GHVP01040386.1~~GHVP01040386.1.p1  ORF type:complete len:111 (+),score=9.80 GHVP01040386.1:162-494(+)
MQTRRPNQTRGQPLNKKPAEPLKKNFYNHGRVFLQPCQFRYCKDKSIPLLHGRLTNFSFFPYPICEVPTYESYPLVRVDTFQSSRESIADALISRNIELEVDAALMKHRN